MAMALGRRVGRSFVWTPLRQASYFSLSMGAGRNAGRVATSSIFPAASNARNLLHMLVRLWGRMDEGQKRAMSMSEVSPQEGTVTVIIVDPVTAKEGRQIQARIGASVLDVAQEHDMVSSVQDAQ